MATVETLTELEAWEIAAVARKYLLDRGKTASICVVNLMGRALVRVTMDSAQPYSQSLARLKAEHSASIGRRTRFIRDKVADPDHPYTLALLGIDTGGYAPWAGGIPIFRSDGLPLGALGISNLSEDEDEACAIHSVESLGYRSDRPS